MNDDSFSFLTNSTLLVCSPFLFWAEQTNINLFDIWHARTLARRVDQDADGRITEEEVREVGNLNL